MMLLLRQLPAGPLPMPVPFISLRLPSSSILLALLASLVLLSLVRGAVFLVRRNPSTKVRQPQVDSQVEEKTPALPEDASQQRLSWAALFPWARVSLSLPVTLAPVDKESIGKGVGMQQRREEKRSERWQPHAVRRGGPTFETPLPAIYQSDEPISMAKMIMSRHTRKPANRPPPRIVIPPTRKIAPPPPQLVPVPPSQPPSMV